MLSLDSDSYMYVSTLNHMSGLTAVLKTPWMMIKENDNYLGFDYALNGMKLDVVAEGRDGSRSKLQSLIKSTNKTYSHLNLDMTITTEYRVNNSSSTGCKKYLTLIFGFLPCVNYMYVIFTARA